MAISAKMVKELREMTGAGMMDCKKALTATDGDMEKAVDFLREKGMAAAQKKAARIAAEGLCKTLVVGNKAVVVEVNSETDFVAKNADFQAYVAAVAGQALNTTAADIDAFMAEPWCEDASLTVAEALSQKISVIGEKLSIRRFEQVEAVDGVVVDYVHGGGKIGVLVQAETAVDNEAVREALKNIAMQIAAMNPQYVSRDEISADELVKMREITVMSALNTPDTLPKPILNKLIEQAIAGVWSAEDVAMFNEKKSNMNYVWNFMSEAAKPQLATLAVAAKDEIVTNKIFNGLVDGRVAKQLKDICLMDQVYVKAEDGKQTVAKYMQEVSKAAGSAVTLKKFVRLVTGEGMQKKEENFAEEVAKQMGN